MATALLGARGAAQAGLQRAVRDCRLREVAPVSLGRERAAPSGSVRALVITCGATVFGFFEAWAIVGNRVQPSDQYCFKDLHARGGAFTYNNKVRPEGLLTAGKSVFVGIAVWAIGPVFAYAVFTPSVCRARVHCSGKSAVRSKANVHEARGSPCVHA